MNKVEKMEQALEVAKKAICHHARTTHTCDSLAWENSTINANCGDILCGHRDLCEAKTAIQKALASPLRNCDVGTAEEQTERFKQLCRKYRRGPGPRANCKGCPVSTESQHVGCTFAWAQMPYEKEGSYE